MRIPLYQIDAFADGLFTGNPAAVCPLEEWLPDDVMQAIAAENNLSETAFFVAEGEGWHLRWFTPEAEIDLCGHATLATAFVIFRFMMPQLQRAVFRTEKAGALVVTRDGERLALDFPAWPPTSCPPPPGLAQGLGREPVEVLAARDYLAVYDDAEVVAGLVPDFAALARLDRHGIIVTQRRGQGGFGYDPLFLVPEYHQTFGELSSRVKHALSHRARALGQLRPTLRQLLLKDTRRP